jgi:hypothetical protein
MKKLFIAFAAVMLVAAFATTSVAGDWGFYGSARVGIWSKKTDDGAGRSERDTQFQLQNNSRLGARVSAKDLYGRFEFGINPEEDNQSPFGSGGNSISTSVESSSVYLRLLYGVWDFGAGKLLVGQDYTPIYLGVSNANTASGSDSVMIGWGVVYDRSAQIRLEFGGLHIALVDNTGFNLLAPATGVAFTGSTTKMSLPRIDAKYTFKFDPVKLDIVGSYFSYNIERPTLSDLSVDAYMFGARADAMLGPVRLRGAAYWTQNGSQLGISGGGSAMLANPATANTAVIDNEAMGYAITALYKLNDMISFEAGYGYTQNEMDDAAMPAVAGGSGATQEDDRSMYYLQSVVKMAPGVFLVPEIGVQDGKENSTGGSDGDMSYIGAKFQIDF